jgi:hypothetical protein
MAGNKDGLKELQSSLLSQLSYQSQLETTMLRRSNSRNWSLRLVKTISQPIEVERE